ncbi:MAG: DUF5615 family PIN-like protein [Cyanobacteria bacterium SBC]|nr:DUF5615 family PIN-like protein [Cyanobacteria bacterium SBC]
MQFLANENCPLPSVRTIRRAGYNIASVTEDSPGIDDRAVLTRAANEKRIILTFDRDYGELIYRLRLPSPKGVIIPDSSIAYILTHAEYDKDSWKNDPYY